MPTIFYSWQSDAPNNTNRSFIERALELAVRDLNTDIVEAERDEVELTQDTQGVPGTPDIAATILTKIESCDVFVCDVSLVLEGEKAKGGTRLCPNPNVMLELGYAMKALGQNRILMVCNTALGHIEDLPFDLRGKRPVPYMADASTDLAEARRVFARVMTSRIQEILSTKKPAAPAPDPVDVALDAVASHAANRKACVRAAIDELLGELDSLNVAPDTSHAAEEELYRVLESSKTVQFRFFELVQRIDEFADATALEGLVLGLRGLAQRYYVPSGHSGVIPAAWFELYYATGRIWLLLATTAFHRYLSWDLLRGLLGARIQVANPREHKQPGRHSLAYLNKRTDYLNRLGRARGRTSLLADLLKGWTEEVASPLPSLEELIDSDLVLALWHGGELVHWWPETVVHTQREPPLLHELQDTEFVGNLVGALGITVDQLRVNAAELQRMVARWLQHTALPPLHDFDPAQIASK